MKKKVITIVLTALVFLSAVFLGLATTFRVEVVSVECTLLSPSVKAQAAEAQAELASLYEKESVFFVKPDKAEKTLEKYSYLRLSKFEKRYPDKLYIRLVEDGESYAVETEGGYYILSSEGVVVERRETPVNRFDGGDNLIVKGLQATGKKGGSLSGDGCVVPALSLCKELDIALSGARRNILCVEVWKRTPETYFRITTREGVKIYIKSPTENLSEKVKNAVDEYLSLSDEERTTGRIDVLEAEGRFLPKYASVDHEN